MINNEFITYGFHLKKEKFNPLAKENPKFRLNKPNGGVWGSPVDSRWGWKDWCISEEFRLGDFGIWTKWRIKDLSRILIIDTYGDLISAMNKYGVRNSDPYPDFYLDFYKMKEDGIDGMMLTENGNAECRLPLGLYEDCTMINLYTWDCESIVVWEWDQIEILENSKIETLSTWN